MEPQPPMMAEPTEQESAMEQPEMMQAEEEAVEEMTAVPAGPTAKQLKLQALREQNNLPPPQPTKAQMAAFALAAQKGQPDGNRWGKVNTDQYLWNFAGGATPLNVRFGENAFVPSAMHLQSVQDQEKYYDGKHRQGDAGYSPFW